MIDSESFSFTIFEIFFSILAIYILILVSLIFSCKKDDLSNVPNVTLGSQIWMTENLNVNKFRNGDIIPEAKSSEDWKRAGVNGEPVWCYYNNNSDNGKRYGKLYNWYAVNDPRGLAPKGWRIPSNVDWTILTDFLGGIYSGDKLKDTGFWINDNSSTNESGFSALPGGYRNDNGVINYFGSNGYWWSLTEFDTKEAWLRHLHSSSDFVSTVKYSKRFGFSVRCLKD